MDVITLAAILRVNAFDLDKDLPLDECLKRFKAAQPRNQEWWIRRAEAYLKAAGDPVRRLTPEQEKRAINLLHFLDDGCAFSGARRWQSGSCAADSGKGFDCANCEARTLLAEIGEKKQR